jgi:hypothetical protein
MSTGHFEFNSHKGWVAISPELCEGDYIKLGYEVRWVEDVEPEEAEIANLQNRIIELEGATHRYEDKLAKVRAETIKEVLKINKRIGFNVQPKHDYDPYAYSLGFGACQEEIRNALGDVKAQSPFNVEQARLKEVKKLPDGYIPTSTRSVIKGV